MHRLLFCLLAISVCLPLVQAHELPEGVVERDVQIIIFPERIEVQYTIEMNEKTMRAEFGKLRPDLTSEREPRKAWDQYRLAVNAELPKRIVLAINDFQPELKTTSSQTLEKHGIQLMWVMSAEMGAKSDSQSITLHDKNFNDKPGYHRLALKGRRGVKIEQSTAPVIVSQVPRSSWAELTEAQKNRATRVAARFQLP